MPGLKQASKTRTVLLVVFAAFVIFVALVILAGEVIVQEGNPLPVIRAVLKLELTGADIVPLNEDGSKLIQKAGPEDPLTKYLAASGWVFRERLGAAIFYEKDSKKLTVEARMLTRRYVVFELSCDCGGNFS